MHENILGHGYQQQLNTPFLCQEVDQTLKAGRQHVNCIKTYLGKMFGIKQAGKYFVRSVT